VHPKRKVILSVKQVDEKVLSVATTVPVSVFCERFRQVLRLPFHFGDLLVVDLSK
jgi:hypothetical protein